MNSIHGHDDYTEWAVCDDCNPEKVECIGCGEDCSSTWDGDNEPVCLDCLISHAENYYNQDGGN
jgi:hypothetical protein